MNERKAGIPIPPRGTPSIEREGTARPDIYRWRDFKIGESQFYPSDKPLSVSMQAHNFANRKMGGVWRFATRTVEEDGMLGVRVWRIEDRKPRTEIPHGRVSRAVPTIDVGAELRQMPVGHVLYFNSPPWHRIQQIAGKIEDMSSMRFEKGPIEKDGEYVTRVRRMK